MTDNQTPPSDEQLAQVGWWCWRGNNHGHLATQPCRSDNVPIHVPVEWAGEMRAVIQRIEDGDGEDAPDASAVVAVAVPPTGQTALRDRIAEVLARFGDVDQHAMADAVLAVLPPPADRAAVLAEAIATLEQVRDTKDVNVAVYPRYDQHQQRALDAGISSLRRLADEAQQQPDIGIPSIALAGLYGQLAEEAAEWGGVITEQAFRRKAAEAACTAPAVVSAVPPQPEETA